MTNKIAGLRLPLLMLLAQLITLLTDLDGMVAQLTAKYLFNG